MSKLLEATGGLVGILFQGIEEIIPGSRGALDELCKDVADAGIATPLMWRGEEHQQPGRVNDERVRRVEGRFDKGLRRLASPDAGPVARACLTTRPPRLWHTKTSGLCGASYSG